jgi:hypothetical protein
MLSETAKSIEDISGSLVMQLENLEGLCSILRPLGRTEGGNTIDPTDFVRTLGVIAEGLNSVRAGVEHIESLAANPLSADGCTTLKKGR